MYKVHASGRMDKMYFFDSLVEAKQFVKDKYERFSTICDDCKSCYWKSYKNKTRLYLVHKDPLYSDFCFETIIKIK